MAKLILLDIFSYSCMNCLRSLEYIKRIDNNYRKNGLKTIIVHPPEWDFEKQGNNILNAAKEYHIRMPIIIDKNYKIIKKLKFNFWPAQVLVKNKKELYRHIGEGNYKELENAIIKNLKIKSKNVFKKEPEYSKFPAVYCGKRKKGRILKLNGNKLKFGIIYAGRNWIQEGEFMKSLKNDSSLTIMTKGRITNFVAQSLGKKAIKVAIKLNNKKVKTISINKPKLYTLSKINNNRKDILNIIAGKNLAIYSFSFQ